MIRVFRTVKKEVGMDCADFAVSAESGRPEAVIEHDLPVGRLFDLSAGLS